MSEIDAERSILRGFDWHRGRSAYDLSFTHHFLRYLGFLVPHRLVDGVMTGVEQNPWFQKMVSTYEDTRLEGRKICNLIGSQSSGKTDYFATFVTGLTSIDPAYTKAYCASPFLTAAESGMWGRTLTRVHDMRSANPKMWADLTIQPSKNRIIYPGVHAEGGFLELRTVDKVGKLQGAKSYNPNRGMLLLMCDEIALFPTSQLLDLLDNLCANPNFFCYTGCNFKNLEGLDGRLGEPEHQDYADLNPDEDQEWDSAYSSKTFRFDGHLSPNVLAGKTIYPYLLTEERRAAMELQHGQNGPKYLEQIRSFPNTSMSDYFVTSRDKIRAGGVYDDFVNEVGQRTRVAFCDPGFGGDPCKIGVFEFCRARLQGINGDFYVHEIFQPVAPIETVKVDARMQASPDWVQRVGSVSANRVMINPGQNVTIEQQIAVQAAEYLERQGVSRNNFGFDGSMRAGIVQEMVTIIGTNIRAFDYGGQPTERETDIIIAEEEGMGRRKVAREVYSNYVTELWFNVAAAIQAGQLRKGEMLPAALTQLCRRKWISRGEKKQIEPKDDFKQANNQQSPDDADVLVGAFEMAQLAGFAMSRRRTPTSEGNRFMQTFKRMFNGGGEKQADTNFLHKTAKKLNR